MAELVWCSKERFFEKVETTCDFAVIPDLHGSWFELKQAIELLRGTPLQVVFLGDYVDTRGPESNCSVKTVELCIQAQKELPSTVFLKGNHELELMRNLDALDAKRLPALGSRKLALVEYQEQFGLVPERHLKFFRGLRAYYEAKNLIFVHGGIPDEHRDLPLADIPEEAILWEYGVARRYEGKRVICGHMVVESPELTGNAIYLETGVWRPGGYLTVAFLQDKKKKNPMKGIIKLSPGEEPEFYLEESSN
jgi:serine/threonine protein phosphatase 1